MKRNIANVLDEMQNSIIKVQSIVNIHKRPNWIKRNWHYCLLGIIMIPLGMKLKNAINFGQIWNFLVDFKVSASNLVSNWVLSPLYEIWKIIRYNESKIAAVSAKTLQSDLQVTNLKSSPWNEWCLTL